MKKNMSYIPIYSFLSQIYVAMLHPLILLLSSLNPQFQHPSLFVLESAEHDPLSHRQVAVSRFLSP
jgi:hypothetical protein